MVFGLLPKQAKIQYTAPIQKVSWMWAGC